MAALKALRALLAAALLLAGMPAHAELRALLIGVSGYPALPERLRLQGPRNDVQRLRQILLQRGLAPARLRVLADGVPGATLPTRANILAALDDLARDAQADDVVVVHFAGHGSRQPAGDGSGLAPVFLPLDVGPWDGGARSVQNAITSPELRAALDRIGDRGAFVWAIVDACHSAALVRGASDAGSPLQYRQVDPAVLGVPQAELARAAARGLPAHETPGGPAAGNAPGNASGNAPDNAPDSAAEDRSGARRGALDAAAAVSPGARRGGTAYFYATQAGELTPELSLPPGDPRRQRYGLFSHVVGRVLERGEPISYRQMTQAILAEYGGLADAHGTPVFSGGGLDARVLGQAAPPLRQWPLVIADGPAVALGSLSGLGVGAVFALLPGPLARDAEALGHLRARSVEADAAALEPVAHGGKAAPRPDQLKPGQYLRLVVNPPAYPLRVALDPGDCPRHCPQREAVQALQAQGVPQVDAQWVAPNAAPDLLLRIHQQQVLMLTPARQQQGPAGLATAMLAATREQAQTLAVPALAAQIGEQVHRFARSRNLLALAARLSARAQPATLRVSLQRSRDGAAITVDQLPTLHSGELLSLRVENTGTLPQDLTVLYFNADHGIGALFPTRQGETNRLDPGASRVIDRIRIDASPAGTEHLMLIAVEARQLAQSADYRFLAQPALTRRRAATSEGTKDGASDDAESLDAFADAAFAAHRSRSPDARPAPPSGRTQVHVFSLNVQP